MPPRGAAIRARRQALDRSLESVAAATRIPAAHLQALEDDRRDLLPPGPFAAAYVRAVCAELGIEDPLELELDEEIAPPLATPPQGAPLWLVRALAGLSLVALAVLLGSLAWERLGPGLPMPMARVPDQHLEIIAQRPTRVVVDADGERTVDQKLAAGESVSVQAADRLVVRVEATSHVRLVWNGTVMVPQGRQDAPRELVFVDDRGLGW